MTVWYWHNDRHTVQQNNSAEGTEIHLYNYGQLIFNKDATVFKGEGKVFSINSTETTGYPHAKENEIPPSYTKIKAK